jgi:hypothetical protein
MITSTRLPLFPLLITAALLMTVLMNGVGEPLMNTAAPSGIVSFELAGSPQASALILKSWDASQQRFAAFSLGLDYLFMLTYAGAIAWACLKAGGMLLRCSWPFGRLTRWAAGLAVLAALFDAVENVALAVILFSSSAAAPWPQLAAVCAKIKFALLFLAFVYIFYALAAALAARLSPR